MVDKDIWMDELVEGRQTYQSLLKFTNICQTAGSDFSPKWKQFCQKLIFRNQVG